MDLRLQSTLGDVEQGVHLVPGAKGSAVEPAMKLSHQLLGRETAPWPEFPSSDTGIHLRPEVEVGPLSFASQLESNGPGPLIFGPVLPDGSLVKDIKEGLHVVIWPELAEQPLYFLPGVQETRRTLGGSTLQ